MAQIKAHEFDRFTAGGKASQRLFLVYGPDHGLVSERAGILAGKSGVSLDDPFSLVRFDWEEIRSDPGRLFEEAGSIALFGGERLIWLRGAGNDKALVSAVAALCAEPPETATILIEAGDLKKGSALRKAVESAPGGLAVPCYSDDGRALQGLIDDELSRSNLRITPAARARLADSLGGDRLASRGELQKLALYCRGSDQVSEEDVIAVVGDASASSVDDAVDAVLVGDVDALDQAMRRIMASKIAVYTVLAGCMRQFQLLDAMRGEIEGNAKTTAQVMGSLGRQIHFRRKPAIEKALSRWTGPALARVLDHFQRAVLESRRTPRLEDDIAHQAVLAVALRSARSR